MPLLERVHYMSFFVLLFAMLTSATAITVINACLTVTYAFFAWLLYWFYKNEEMLRETPGFRYLTYFFAAAALNRFSATLYFFPGLGWLVPLCLFVSLIVAIKTAHFTYQNRVGILLAVSIRRRMIDTDLQRKR